MTQASGIQMGDIAGATLDGRDMHGRLKVRAGGTQPMATEITTRPLYGWAQPTQAGDWTANMLERLPNPMKRPCQVARNAAKYACARKRDDLRGDQGL